MKILIKLTLLLIITTASATPLGEYFTYQGELIVNGQPANDNYDIVANLYSVSTGGTTLGGDGANNVQITNGLFSLELDIGSTPFIGDEVWIELSVKLSGAASYTDLPRQKITNAPYAIHSQFVGSSGVNSDAIQTSAVTTFKLADDAVTQDKMANSSVGTLQIINASVTTNTIADGAVTLVKMANNSVNSAQIIDGSVTENELSNDAVTSSHIVNSTIVAADIDNSSIQQRVTGTCAAGSSIRSISANGEVMCENDDTNGTPAWNLSGNSGITSGTHFIGTIDNIKLELKANNYTGIQLLPVDTNGVPDPGLIMEKSTNIILGSTENTISSLQFGSTIAGGTFNEITTAQASGFNVLGGGFSNKIIGGEIMNAVISGGFANEAREIDVSIVGGSYNIASGSGSAIGGGYMNKTEGKYSSIPGGSHNLAWGENSFAVGNQNKAGGLNSIALGKLAYIRDRFEIGNPFVIGDDGTFVWSQTGVTSTGINQVLFEAQGGFGIGTNIPKSPFHIVGEGTSIGSVANSNEVVMTIEPKTATNDVAVVINKRDNSKEAALIFSANSQPEFDIRTVNGGAMDFNYFDNLGAQRIMMRINDGPTQRIDMNANIEPWLNNTYNLGGITGGTEYRWATLFTTDIDTTNAVNVTSDKRLKENINDIKYGLTDILSMRPVSYNMKKGDTQQLHLGLIAQEVETIIPEVVSQKDDKKHTRSMRYSELIPVLIKATQEQQALIEHQNQAILIQTKKIERLEALVNNLGQTDLIID